MVNISFQKNMVKLEGIAIDESLCRGKMRFKHKMYLPNKPGRFGALLRLACDTKTNYCFAMKLYSGKQVDKDNSAEKIFEDLLTNFTSKSHGKLTVYADNYYTCNKVITLCKKKGFEFIGTIRPNRYQNAIPNKVLKLGEIKVVVVNMTKKFWVT